MPTNKPTNLVSEVKGKFSWKRALVAIAVVVIISAGLVLGLRALGDYWDYEGGANFLRGDLSEARDYFSKALLLRPHDAKLYAKRGLTYLFESRWEEALADFTRSIELDPTLGATYSNRGDAYYALGNLQAAYDDYNLAVDLDPAYPNSYLGRGASNEKLGNKEAAIEDYREFLALTREGDSRIEIVRERIHVLGGEVP